MPEETGVGAGQVTDLTTPSQPAASTPSAPASSPAASGGASVPGETIPTSQELSSLQWDMPLEWTGTDGKTMSAKVGDLIGTYGNYQGSQQYIQLGQLFEQAMSGDQKAAQVLHQLMTQQNQQAQTPPQQSQPQVDPAVANRLSSMEQMLLERTQNDVKNGLNQYIRNSNYSALKEMNDPRIADALMNELLRMTSAGVQPSQKDVDNILTSWNKYYEDQAMKIAGPKFQNRPAGMPPLGRGAAAPVNAGTPKSPRWGTDPANPSQEYTTYLKDKITNMLANSTP